MIDRRDAKASRDVARREATYKRADGRFRRATTGPDSSDIPTRPRVAVFAIHGMGQQVPFETLEDVAERLLGAGAPSRPEAPLTLTNVNFDDLRAQRVEMVIQRNGHSIEAHVYEGYWAPITEGQVYFYDVVRFFAKGAWNALRNIATPFYRWMFGRAVQFRPPILPFIALIVATAAAVEVAVIGVLVIGLVVARLPCLCWPSREVLNSVTSLLAILLIAMLAGAAGIQLALFVQERFEGRGIRTAAQAVAVPLVLLASGVCVAILPAILGVAAFHWTPPAWIGDRFGWATRGVPSLFVLAGVLGCSLIARSFLVQYVGDVAAYVSPQALDRFSDLRTEIKDRIGRLAQAIVEAACDDGRFEYDRIAFVGHSLGSVIAYDVLNRLILDETLNLTRARPLERIRLLLTFGSPLDKTALIFGLNGKGTGVIREQLAARVQPLIEDYRFRQVQWVNVYSVSDLFSGKLDFYDDAANRDSVGRRVVNIDDPEALVPLAAHVQYWNTSTVWSILHRELFAPGSTSVGGT